MNALDETTNVSKVMFREWYPQIMYNHHQTGPNGAVMFAPPFRDPFNYNFTRAFRRRWTWSAPPSRRARSKRRCPAS
jgi:hypothetical protein